MDALSDTNFLRVDPETMSWSAAEPVQRVAPPNIPAGADPVSLMLSSYLPGLVEGANEKVAAAQANDQAFAGKVSSARSAYQSGDEAGGQTIQKAGENLNPASAAGKAGVGADGGMGQFGQMMGMAMQAFQAPAQAMQALGSVPQTAMQAAQQIGQQVQQLAGQSTKGGGKPGEGGAGGVGGAAGQQLQPQDRKPGEEKAREDKRDEKPEEKKDSEADKKHAAAGPSSGPSAPVPPSSPAPRSGRHAANPAVDV
ncbi:hypothetical protein [Mycolicibacterium sp. CBMA 226]|uniref:hypothetical protein n=1 Tax=Mycolicibacterium sp. CBMA 226 TaxID=2606611 RepID=UPI001305EC7E|nr:hypothetical protein [Mycolicibacterium sp. CBMA 226]MUL75062.1 hypothetical protein [Mycolicibacterium sp. CBMA 226]